MNRKKFHTQIFENLKRICEKNVLKKTKPILRYYCLSKLLFGVIKISNERNKYSKARFKFSLFK